tara:strand:+ start:6903 stop:7232 length:330 start_codon:yes stop_codon:yes gene_type:complete
LTKQENRVAHLVAKGFSEKEIATNLFVSYNTVHTHTRNIRRKTGARNIADITRNYILTLRDPRKVLIALAFCFIEIGLVLTAFDYDERRAKINKGKKAYKIINVRRNEV